MIEQKEKQVRETECKICGSSNMNKYGQCKKCIIRRSAAYHAKLVEKYTKHPKTEVCDKCGVIEWNKYGYCKNCARIKYHTNKGGL